MKKNRIDVITLGCSKNLVDSERLLKRFEDCGYEVAHDSDNVCGEVVVINTCGFIGDAKEESINTILEYVEAKREHRIKHLFVMGCLSERYFADLKLEIPEVDKFYGKFNWAELINDLKLINPPTKSYERHLTTPSHYAYLKISEGCNRFCAFCAIPLITGRHTSVPMEQLEEEVRTLVGKGVKEFNVIAQDLSSYGTDLYGRIALPELVERIAAIEGVEWIRLHYAYPTQFPYEILPVMARHKNVFSYLDIALQHISDNMLQRMHRHVTKEETYNLIERIRKEVPGIHLRTTLMVGFPGETEEDFEELMEFTRKVRFERMGAFAYSEEEGTFSAEKYEDNVPEEIKQARLDKLMALQQRISAELEAEKVGKTMKVVIDRKEGNYYVGRTEYSSPEVDPEVLIPVGEKKLRTGQMVDATITDSEEFDLYAKVE